MSELLCLLIAGIPVVVPADDCVVCLLSFFLVPICVCVLLSSAPSSSSSSSSSSGE